MQNTAKTLRLKRKFYPEINKYSFYNLKFADDADSLDNFCVFSTCFKNFKKIDTELVQIDNK